MYKILIVEDDDTITSTVAAHLASWDYNVQTVTDFHQVLSHFQTFQPHLVLLDIALPFFNGYHWCTEIRKTSQVPIIFISSTSDNLNIVMAMNMGADDFIPKPFDLSVLTAKISALLRRTYAFAEDNTYITVQGVTLNTDSISLNYNDHQLDLTKNDYRILQVLMEKAGTVVSRSTLMEQLWATDCFIDDNTLTVNINRLRHRLSDIGLTDFIQTKRGIGYTILK